MISAVGLTAKETATSVRSTTMRFTEASFLDHRFEPFTVAEIPADGLPQLDDAVEKDGLTSREARLLRIGTAALVECVESVPVGATPLALMLSLPELQTTEPLEPMSFLRRFEQQSRVAIDLSASQATHTGRAGGLIAIGKAIQTIAKAQADFVVAGGIDSYLDPYILGTLDLNQRINSTANLDGFIPGEAAAFLLLANAAKAESAGLTPVAFISAVAEGFEVGHIESEEPYRGEGLAAVFQKLTEAGAAPAISDVYSSMNGESHWAKEWGVAFLRTSSAFAPEHGMHHPADCLGDLGAACGPLMAGLAALGIRDGYRGSPTLVYGSSDKGARAALILRAA
ncbi:MAG: hypothetical protein JSV86_13605 [Gemmatimonadota bacterium]|nr:MAG: hypothetical protein JSV86_13605 [Gemmatimonadota bacterium]